MFLTKQIKRHTSAIRQCLLMIENIEIYISYNNVSISELFLILNESCMYTDLHFIQSILHNINCDSTEIVLNDITSKCIDSSMIFDVNDKEYIKGFLSMLGKSDVNGQILNCKRYKEIFKNKLCFLEKKEQDKCKCVSTLVIGMGLLLAIIII